MARKYITLAQLRRVGSCAEQLKEFESRYGTRAEVTIIACREAAQVFSWDVGRDVFLTCKQRRIYDGIVNPAREEYYAAMAAAQEAYNVQRAEAFARAFTNNPKGRPPARRVSLPGSP